MNQNKIPVTKKSAVPIWAAAATFFIESLYFNFYKLSHYIVAGIAAAAVGFVVSKIAKPVTVWTDKPKSGNIELDNALSTLAEASEKLERAKPVFFSHSTEAANYIASMKASVDGMYTNLSSHPEDLKIAKKFLVHYLPMVLKMTDSYTELSQHPDVDNIASSMRAIEGALVSIDDALKRQLDAQFANDNLDITTDIEVLNTVLSNDGNINNNK